MSTSPPSSPYTHTPDDIARKRARDRKSQRAMRDRTKYTIIELQSHVAQLSTALATQTSLLQSTTALTALLQAENQRLKNQLEESKYVGSDMCLENFRFPRSDSMLSDLPLPKPLPGPGTANSKNNEEGIHIFFRVPVNCAPICLSDRILQSYIQARRGGTKDTGTSITATKVVTEQEQPAWLPDINALLAPQGLAPTENQEPSVDNRSVSTVVSDILLSYHEINSLPKKVAALYIMYKLLNVSTTHHYHQPRH